ncbi:hypothetical protein HK101_001418, partial [Irineochytrium annulatum]
MNKAIEQAIQGYTHIKISGCDIDGIPRGKLVIANKFRKSIDGGFGFCNVIFGWDCHDRLYDTRDVKVDDKEVYPDIQAVIDISTLRRIPWEKRIPHFLVDFHDPHTNLPMPQCPRGLLKRIVAKGKQMGFKANVGIEYEFFNFQETPESLAVKEGTHLKKLTPGMFGYSLTRPILHQDYYHSLLDSCNDFNIPIEGLHTETGPGVYEVALQYSEPIQLADSAHLFKLLAKSVGLKHGVMPTFMAKPHNDLPGCSGHVHVSLVPVDSGVNAFASKGEDKGTMVPFLSRTAESFLAGVLKGLPS